MNEPIDPQFLISMNASLEAIDELFNGPHGAAPRKVGIVLLTFPYGDYAGGRCNYISNGADRADIVSMFKEIIARWEGMPSPPPGRPQ